MGLYCILCGKKDKSVFYLRFPSNKQIRKQWLKFCNKSEKNVYASHRLCTDHFKPEDLRKCLKCVVVHEKAIPCIYTVKGQFLTVENASKINDDNICSIKTEQISDPENHIMNESYLPSNNCLTPLKRKDQNVCYSSKRKHLDFDSIELVSNDTEIGNCETPPNTCLTKLATELVSNDTEIGNREIPPNTCLTELVSNDTEIGNRETPSNTCLTELISNETEIGNRETPPNTCLTELVSNDTEIDNRETPNTCLTELATELVSNDGIDSIIPIQELPVSVPTPAICYSAPSIPNPRYVGDIQLAHFATPRRGTRAINVIRRSAMQRQKIETLQKKNKRCKQRISSLKDMVLHLKKNNYISEAVADN